MDLNEAPRRWCSFPRRGEGFRDWRIKVGSTPQYKRLSRGRNYPHPLRQTDDVPNFLPQMQREDEFPFGDEVGRPLAK